MKQNNLLPLPPGRTLIFERNESDIEGSFVCSACRKDFHTADPAEGMTQFNLHQCEHQRKRPMESFDKYDEIDYTGKSDPDIWETHVEFFFSRQTAMRRYAEIKRFHPEAAKKTAVRPFFRPKGEIEIHPDMIKDFASENLATAKGVWQFEYWLPSTEKQAAEYEGRMSAKDPGGWTTHRGRAKQRWAKHQTNS